MLEPLIVSTRACDLIISKLGLSRFKRGSGLFGKDTERKNLLVIGDVDSDFMGVLSTLSVKVTLIRTVPRTWDPAPRSQLVTEVVGVSQLSAMDSHQFSVLVLADPSAVLSKDQYYHLWRVLDGHAKCVAWVPAYMARSLDESSLRMLGAQSSDVTPLGDYDCPGNYLHYFETRKDQSKFHQT